MGWFVNLWEAERMDIKFNSAMCYKLLKDKGIIAKRDKWISSIPYTRPIGDIVGVVIEIVQIDIKGVFWRYL
jgi:hypothetical protein